MGPSGAALIGMQFVVMTLIAGRDERPTTDALKAFATPIVVNLAAALLVSAIMSAPSRPLVVTSIALAVFRGASLAAYVAR